MKTSTNHSRPALFCLILLPLLSGCSLLGFSPYPVAHVMTDDTKAVLANTPGASNVARELSKEVQSNHFLEPGDELLLETVGGDPNDFDDTVRLPADQRVLADGTIDLAEFGRIIVAGMTMENAEAAIQRIINQQSGKSVRVNVRLIQPIHSYYVIGEVNSPGAYPLTGHETVLDAIMEAGGLTARASACDLLLARPTNPCSCRVTLPVCYRAITQLGDTTTNYHLKPGDRIFVARQSMCEEMCAYIIGGKTCDRCCNSQAACRDPRSISTDAPEFALPGTDWIPPVEPPAAKSLDQIEGVAPATEPEADPLQPNLEEVSPEVDGELDFGMLLQ